MQVMQVSWWCRPTRILVKFTIFIKSWNFQRKKKIFDQSLLASWTFHPSLDGSCLSAKWEFTILRQVHSSYPPDTTIVCYMAILRAHQASAWPLHLKAMGYQLAQKENIQYRTESDKIASATLYYWSTFHRSPVWEIFWGEGKRGIMPAASNGKALSVSKLCLCG